MRRLLALRVLPALVEALAGSAVASRSDAAGTSLSCGTARIQARLLRSTTGSLGRRSHMYSHTR
jgi:hypothetical protein